MRVLLRGLREGAESGEDLRRWLESLGRERPPHPGVSGPVRFGPAGDAERSYVLRRITVL